MATAPCPRCGGLAPRGAGFCPFCGSPLSSPLAAPPPQMPATPGHYAYSGPPPPGYYGAGPPMSPPGYYGGVPPGYGMMPGFASPSSFPSPATRPLDQDSLTYLFWAAVIVLAAGAVSLALFASSSSLYSTDATVSGTALVFSALFFFVIVASSVLTFVEVFLLRAAFHRLEPVDPRFSTPSKLSLLLIIGLALVLVGLVPLLLGTQSLSNCVINSPNPSMAGNCSGFAEILVGALVVLVGGILALVGYIGCLIGIWRFGSRYSNDLFKVGAILLIIPFISLVGAILILIASHSARTRLGTPPGSGFSIH
jgi:hypothetical protein